MLYAGNSGEAHRKFADGASNEPDCAMAHWGAAISRAISEAPAIGGDKRNTQPSAIAPALNAGNASQQERRLVLASASRFGDGPTAGLRRAFAYAMRGYVRDFPEDIDGVFLSCLATFQAYGWDLMVPEARHLIPDLDRVLRTHPSHEGAHFLRIRSCEYLRRFDEGDESAASLEATVDRPGLGQLLHRASHVHWRHRRLDAAIGLNLAAIRNNLDYILGGDAEVTRSMRGFHSHVVSTVIYQLMLVGRQAEAVELAQRASWIHIAMVALRQRRWHDVLATGRAFILANAIANARIGRYAQAEDAAALFRSESHDQNFRVQLALTMAAKARALGDVEQELQQYRVAYDNSDWHYDPPLYWSYPVVEGYGAAMLRLGQYRQAEDLFANTFEMTPYDPYIAAGLNMAKRFQGKPILTDWLQSPRLGSWGAKLELDDLG